MTGAGYSASPLAKKLGIAACMRVAAIDAPGNYRTLVGPWPEGTVLASRADADCDLVHLFVRARAALGREAAHLRELLGDEAVLWISWPKKAAKVVTDLTEDGVRELVLPLGWVDVKVCAVEAVWSALKLVVRRELRGRPRRR